MPRWWKRLRRSSRTRSAAPETAPGARGSGAARAELPLGRRGRSRCGAASALNATCKGAESSRRRLRRNGRDGRRRRTTSSSTWRISGGARSRTAAAGDRPRAGHPLPFELDGQCNDARAPTSTSATVASSPVAQRREELSVLAASAAASADSVGPSVDAASMAPWPTRAAPSHHRFLLRSGLPRRHPRLLRQQRRSYIVPLFLFLLLLLLLLIAAVVWCSPPRR